MEKLKYWLAGRRTLLILLLAAGWPLIGVHCFAAANTDPVTNNLGPASSPDISRLRFSAGLADVLRLVKANVDTQVIKAFINHSPVAYNPSAQEIIVLKKFGVPDDLVETLLAHQPSRPQPMPPYEARSEPPPPESAPPAMPFGPPPFAQYFPPPAPAPVVNFPLTGPLISFNNSYPTFVNGNAVYSGYYAPGYGYLW